MEVNPFDARTKYVLKLKFEVRCQSFSMNLISPRTEIAEASACYRTRLYIAWPMLNQVGQDYLEMQANENAAQLGKLFHKWVRGSI